MYMYFSVKVTYNILLTLTDFITINNTTAWTTVNTKKKVLDKLYTCKQSNKYQWQLAFANQLLLRYIQVDWICLQGQTILLPYYLINTPKTAHRNRYKKLSYLQTEVILVTFFM